jgi:amino acid transporter
MSAIDTLCMKTGLGGLVAPVALLVVVSCVGGTGAFLSSIARLPFVAGIDHYLPPIFARVHPRWRTPYVAIIFYGLAAILFGLLSQMGASVSGAYDLLVAMGIITAFIPFFFIFASVIRLQRQPLPPGAFRLPGGKPVAITLASLGMLSTIATIILSLFPSQDEPHPLIAVLKIVVMTAVLLAAGAVVYSYGRRAKRREGLIAEQTHF